MAINKNLRAKFRVKPVSSTLALLEISHDGGNTYTVVDSIEVPPSAIAQDYEFSNHPTVDLSDPTLFVKIRFAPTSSTSTSSSSTSSTTSTTTTTQPHTGDTFTLVPGSDGRLIINNTNNFYQPGDTIRLRGTFLSVTVINLSGVSGNPILITNYPGETTYIGEITWNGGSYSNAFPISNSHYLKICGESKSRLIFEGSTQAQRTAYNIFYAAELTDNLEVCNFTLRNGGTGLTCKTNPVQADPRTYDNGAVLNNFSFHDGDIYNTLHEGMYIGHTAKYWDFTAGGPFYGTLGDPSTGWISGHVYVSPLKLNNVKIFNMNIHDVGYDGIQTAAINNLEVYFNEVINYGTGEHAGDISGICNGGKNTNTYFHDNIVHDGHGEFMYVFGEGPNHIISNNLFYNNSISTIVPAPDGITIRGTNQLQVTISHNTIATIGVNAIRINSYFETGTKPPMLLDANAIMAPKAAGGTVFDPQSYFYTENGGSYILGTGANINTKFLTVAAANVDVNNYYQPNPGSPVGLSGYRPNSSGTTTTSTSTTTTSSTTSTTTTTTPGDFPAKFVSVNHTGNQWAYMYTSQGYNPADTSTKLPLIVFLHGAGEIGTGTASGTGLPKLLVAGPPKYLNSGDKPTDILIFSPQTNNNTWEPGEVDTCINYVKANYNVDVDRIYLTGLSLGGSGTSKYVANNPNKIAAYLLATADGAFIRNAANTTIGGVRVADVPGWYLGGTDDGIINVNNGGQTLDVLNALIPTPTYPFLVSTFWNVTHSTDLWDTQVYNRKNRTDETGTASFDYIDWFKLYKLNDLLINATNYTVLAESSLDYNDYLAALRLVNKLSVGTPQTDLLARLATVKSTISGINRIYVLDLGATVTASNYNAVNTSSSGSSSSPLSDIDGNASGIVFTTVTVGSSPASVAVGLGNDYFGFDKIVSNRAVRVYGTSNNSWRFSNLNDGKTYKLRFICADKNQFTNLHSGCTITINGNTLQADNAMYNTNKFVDFTNITPVSGQINITLSAYQSNWQGDMIAIVLFESVSGGTTTTSSTSTSSTSSTSTSSTSSTTTSSTTSTTTTTGAPVFGQAKFGFSLDNTYTSPGFAKLIGNPATTDISQTQNGITLSNVRAAWQNFGAFYAGNDDGMSTGTFGTDFPANIVRGYWINYDNVFLGSGSYNLIASGLNPAKTYTIKFIASVKSSINPLVMVDLNVLSGGANIVQTLNAVDNTQNILTFSGVIPDGTGKISFGLYKKQDSTGGTFGLIGGLIITEEP